MNDEKKIIILSIESVIESSIPYHRQVEKIELLNLVNAHTHCLIFEPQQANIYYHLKLMWNPSKSPSNADLIEAKC